MGLHGIQLAQRFCSHLLLLFFGDGRWGDGRWGDGRWGDGRWGDGRWLAGPVAEMLDAKVLSELYGCEMA
jgi:hypothetical protein